MHLLLFIIVAVFWGHSFLFMKLATPHLGVIGVGAWRVLAGSATLWVIWQIKKSKYTLKRSDIPALILLAIVGYTIPFTIQPFVINKVENIAGHGGAFGGMLVSFVPLFTLLFSIPILKIYPTPRQIIGVIGGLGCMLLLFGAELNLGLPIWLMVVGVMSPLSYALANVYIKRRFSHTPPLLLAMSGLFWASVILIPVTLSTETIVVDANFTKAVIAELVLGVACSGIAVFLYYKLLQERGPLYASMVTYVIPCIAIGVGFVTGEKIHIEQLLAIAGVLVMVAMVQINPKNPREAVAPQ